MCVTPPLCGCCARDGPNILATRRHAAPGVARLRGMKGGGMDDAPKFEGSRKAALAAREGRAMVKDIWSFARHRQRAGGRDSRQEKARNRALRRDRHKRSLA